MDDEFYKKQLLKAEHLRAFIQTCGLDAQLTVEFDGERKEKFDFYKIDEDTRYNPFIYSTADSDKAEGFILGFHFGQR